MEPSKTHLATGALSVFLAIAGVLSSSGAPIISEILADNESGLRDEDGEWEDWLELYNPDPAPYDLGGHFLTDNPDNPTKWRIPDNTVLLPGGFLVIFASGKDRAITSQELHTNFGLDNSGEYLALVSPDGASILDDFTPTYPAQFDDASFGIEQTPVTSEEILIGVDSACRTYVPTDNTLGLSWTQVNFGDNLWSAGFLGAGYERGTGYRELIASDLEQVAFDRNSSVYIRIPFDLARTDDILSLSLDVQYDDGLVAYLNGVRVTSLNAPGAPVFNSSALSDRADSAALDFQTIQLNSHLSRLRTGANVLSLHLMNSSADDDDLLLRPQLSVIRTLSLELGESAYFANPTPGQRNGSQEQLPTSEVVFSHRSQTFIDNFEVSLSSTFPSEVIRYTTDRSEPNANSPRYTGPIPIDNSIQIRARVFGENNAQGPVKMRSFLKVGESVLQQFNSNLPILIIETWNRGDPGGNTHLDGFMAIIEPDPETGRARITDEFATDTRVGLKRRGSSSFGWPKYSMTVEARDEEGLDKGITPLDMPRESDWILSGRYQFDRALMRNDLMYELSRQTGEYATRTKFVEVVHNVRGGPLTYSGSYFGVYSLMEKIKRDDGRVPVARIDPRDSREPAVSGGYMFKKDRLDPGDSGFSVAGLGTLGWVEPKEREVSSRQRSWLTAHMNEINAAISASNGINPSTGKHFTEYIDQFSWLRHHWLNTLAMNVDGFRLSGYYYKHRSDTNDGKVGAGPIWDFDRTMGSTDSRDNNPSQWDGSGDSSRTWSDGRYAWWGQVLSKPDFRQAHTDLWQDLRENVFSTENIESIINDFARQIDGRDPLGANDSSLGRSPAERNFDKWGNASHRNEVRTLKQWLRTRVGWIDRQYTAKPLFSSDQERRQPGVVEVGDQFSFVGDGAVYYTTDGTDPRAPGGNASGSALLANIGEPIAIDGTTTITARARNGRGLTAWSGPITSHFLVGPIANASNLVVTEVHYAPLPPETSEELAAANDASDFEFIEMKNVSGDTINLTAVKFTEGIDFDFTFSDVTSLAPGEFVLVVRNRASFEARYGTSYSDRIAGEYLPTRLENAGERLHLVDGVGNTIANFRYNDRDPWPEAAGRDGSSLVLASPTVPVPDYSIPDNWRASAAAGGNPGTGLLIDSDGDGLSNIDEALAGTDPLRPDTDGDGSTDGSEIAAGTDPLDGSSLFQITTLSKDPLTGFVTVRWDSVPGKSYTLEASSDLINWEVTSSGIIAVGTVTLQLDPRAIGRAQRFYRVSVEE
ncbi:MAG: CotH kinase family protein [Roseibacillus sp.]